MMFSWHRTFTLGLAAPWRKASKKKMPSQSEVVLTNMKMLSSEYSVEMPVPEESMEQHGLFHPDTPLPYKENDSSTNASQSNLDYVSTFTDLVPVEPSCNLRGLYKFESEDSGVELPSGANSPLTPTGSEKSFVVHSRDSSCDSGVLSASSSPAIDHIAIRTHKDTEETNDCILDTEEHGGDGNPDLTEYSHNPALTFEDLRISSEINNQNLHFAKSHETIEEKLDQELEFPETENPSRASGDDLVPVHDAYSDTFDGLQEMNLHGQLKRYPTSDSLDEYMDECCRLSEVNQGSAKAIGGSGLGYLEHICQLIEKIGQLQEHNLRLQKQICFLQKEKNMKQMKEEYFAQHCSCGAARALHHSYQEVKKNFNMRSRPHSMFIQSGNLSDLSMIPEMGGNYENLRYKGSDSHIASGNNPLMLGLRETPSKATHEENEVRHMWNRTEGLALSSQDQAMRRVENHPWGRVRDLVKKTKLKNQNKLGLSSMALKRSCPQLYRPDITSSDLRKKERNSMIVLGQNPKNENAWPY